VIVNAETDAKPELCNPPERRLESHKIINQNKSFNTHYAKTKQIKSLRVLSKADVSDGIEDNRLQQVWWRANRFGSTTKANNTHDRHHTK